MANQIRWYPYADTVIDRYRLYRSIVGIKVDFPSTLRYGDQLVFAATSPTQQTVKLTGSDINTVISNINAQGKGVVATKNSAGTELYIRCTATTDPKFKLMRCSFATKTGQIPRSVTQGSEYVLLTEVTHVPETEVYTIDDAEGALNDWYQVTSVKNEIESIPSQSIAPAEAFNENCFIVGRIMSPGNSPMPGEQISASVMGTVGANPADQSLVSEEKISTFTDEEGRWTLSTTRGQLVLLEIPSIGYNEVVKVPDQDYVLFSSLTPSNDHYFNPTGEQIP